jgi:hypothetical protein
MNPKDPTKDPVRETRTEPPHEESESPKPTAAPPIEREHETSAGALEEDERRKREQR